MPNQTHSNRHTISSLFLKTALPAMVAMVTGGITNLATALFAKALSAQAVAATGIVFSFISLLQSVGYTVALGGSTIIAPLLAQKKSKEIQEYSTATLWLDGILGILFGGFSYFFAQPLAKALGVSDSLLPLCVAYIKPLVLSAPLFFGNYAFTCLLRCVGKGTKATIGLTIGSLATIGGTALFFFVIPLGMAGAGIAFLLGQGISFFILFWYYRNTKELSFTTPPCGLKPLVTIPYYGISSFLRQGFACVSLIVFNRLAMAYGTPLVAAVSVCNRITGLFYSGLLGWGQGFAPLGGYAFGNNNLARFHKALTFGTKTATIAMGIIGGGLVLYGIAAPQNQRLLLISQGITFPLIPLGVFATFGYQSIKKPVVATLLSCLRQGIFFLPLCYLLPTFWQEKGLLLVWGVADLFTFLCCLVPYRKLKSGLSCFSEKEVI